MDIINGTLDHANAVADFWNAKAADPSSWWYGSPTKTGEDIADAAVAGPVAGRRA